MHRGAIRDNQQIIRVPEEWFASYDDHRTVCGIHHCAPGFCFDLHYPEATKL